MSWNDYVNFMTNDSVCTDAYIYGKDGTLWAGSGSTLFQSYSTKIADAQEADKMNDVDVDESKNFFNALGNNGICTIPGGIRLGNEKYFSTNFDGERGTWYLKKQNGGACVAQTNQAILIGIYNNTKTITSKNCPQNPGDTNAVVEKLQETLKGASY